jgi:hypothetical protein
MAAEPPPGGAEATIPAAKAGDAVPPSQQATGITAITAETAGAAQVRQPATVCNNFATLCCMLSRRLPWPRLETLIVTLFI